MTESDAKLRVTRNRPCLGEGPEDERWWLYGVSWREI
jgi:hypothetical protein